jgi:LPS-assembly protein
MSFDGEKQKILASPLYFDFGSQYNYFWRDSGTRGQRLDVYPRFYLPLRIKNYATVEPSAGFRETGYRLDKSNLDDSADTQKWSHRELMDTRIDLFTEIESVFNLDSGRFEKIRHLIRPQVTHEFVTHSNQTDLPQFDPIDRIDDTNRITYSLINTLTSKSRTLAAKKAGPDLAGNRGAQRQTSVDNAYNDFFRLEIEQSYDFERSRKPFSPIFAKLDISPGKYIWFDADAQYSVYENEFLSHNIQASFWDNRGDELYVDYRYEKSTAEMETNEDIQSIFGKITLQLTDRLALSGENSYNLETNQRIQTTGGFNYQAQCWLFEFKYKDKPDDWEVGFKIELLGLGGIGY